MTAAAFGAETDHRGAAPTSPLQMAPLLGAGPSVPVPGAFPRNLRLAPIARRRSRRDRTPLPCSAHRPSRRRQQPIQRDSVSSSPSVATPHAGAGFGAPLRSVPASGTDRISSREMSFEQMFAPGAAAIASGAAYSDSPGSVVFRSPDSTDHPLGSTPTLGAGLWRPCLGAAFRAAECLIADQWRSERRRATTPIPHASRWAGWPIAPGIRPAATPIPPASWPAATPIPRVRRSAGTPTRLGGWPAPPWIRQEVMPSGPAIPRPACWTAHAVPPVGWPTRPAAHWPTRAPPPKRRSAARRIRPAARPGG